MDQPTGRLISGEVVDRKDPRFMVECQARYMHDNFTLQQRRDFINSLKTDKQKELLKEALTAVFNMRKTRK